MLPRIDRIVELEDRRPLRNRRHSEHKREGAGNNVNPYHFTFNARTVSVARFVSSRLYAFGTKRPLLARCWPIVATSFSRLTQIAPAVHAGDGSIVAFLIMSGSSSSCTAATASFPLTLNISKSEVVAFAR